MNKYTVLYVDDEEVNLRLFRNTFRRDFNVLTTQSAAEGLNILNSTRVDVVITDQRMPEITGLEFLKLVNEKFSEIPPSRLMLSGFSKPEEIDIAYQHYKLFKFVSKPWNNDELRSTILNAITDGKQ